MGLKVKGEDGGECKEGEICWMKELLWREKLRKDLFCRKREELERFSNRSGL